MQSWEAIVLEHGPMAFDAAWRLLGHVQDTEDAVQEALADALRAYRTCSVQNWGGLLRRLATRRALDRLRSRRRVTAVEFHDVPSTADSVESIEIAKELTARLRDALAQLPYQQAAVFSLRYFGQMTNVEVAIELNISPEAVAVALHKARSTLARRLGVVDRRATRKSS